MNKRFKKTLPVLLSLGFLGSGCLDEETNINCPERDEINNLSPRVTCFNSSNYNVIPGEVVRLNAQAVDDGRIEFAFFSKDASNNGGLFFESYPGCIPILPEPCDGSEVRHGLKVQEDGIYFRAPDREGDYRIHCTVYDKDRKEDSESITINVNE